MRGQTTLPVLGVALVLVTVVTVLVVTAGQGAVHGASEPAISRSTAVSVSERLVENRSPLTTRQNVLAAGEIDSLDGNYLRENISVSDGVDVSVHLGEQELAATGPVNADVSFERIVMVERTSERRRHPPVRSGEAVTLPRRVERVRLHIRPGPDATVESVAADGEIVLLNESGLAGWYTVNVSRFRTTDLVLDAVGPLGADALTLVYRVPERHRRLLEVRVDA